MKLLEWYFSRVASGWRRLTGQTLDKEMEELHQDFLKVHEEIMKIAKEKNDA